MRAYKKLMSVRQISPLTWLFLIPAGVLVSLYTSLGVIGAWIFGGRINGTADLLFVINPLLALPIFLAVIASLRWATILLWLYFLYVWGFSFVLSCPRLVLNPLASPASWLLLIAVMLVTLAFIVDMLTRRAETRHALVSGPSTA